MAGRAPQDVWSPGITGRDFMGDPQTWAGSAGWCGRGITSPDIIGGPQTWLCKLHRPLEAIHIDSVNEHCVSLLWEGEWARSKTQRPHTFSNTMN
eukprot:10730111-Heterocapsa_arctica.AAC.1